MFLPIFCTKNTALRLVFYKAHFRAVVYYFFQVLVENSTKIGNISSLPISISNIKTVVERGEYIEKLHAGPTFASPGPMLLIAETTAVKLVVKSKLSMLIIKTDKNAITIYDAK